ncbi:EscS/YscS/HrcS family type III secretion system export apparatus protein, partial [Pseudomonas sp. MWU13-2860]
LCLPEALLVLAALAALLVLVLVLAGPWMLNTLIEYTTRLFQSIPHVIG